MLDDILNELENPPSHGTALVVLSGGQDSVTCLGFALESYDNVVAVGFNYGQRHLVELRQANYICDLLQVPFAIFDLPMLGQLGDSALVTSGDVSSTHRLNSDLPNSFVPGRNAMLLCSAYAYALKIQADTIITGTCQTDYSGYPDCRDDFVKQLNLALDTGYLSSIRIVTPLMFLTKAAIFQVAYEMNFLDIVVKHSHTCYLGDRTKFHYWGYGCGECPACKLRKAGFDEFAERMEFDLP